MRKWDELEERAVEVTGLTLREAETVFFIHEYTRSRPQGLQRPPSHRDLMRHLNQRLPRKLVSTQQTQRIIEALRDKGLVMDPETLELPVKTPNMALTPKGRVLARRYAEIAPN